MGQRKFLPVVIVSVLSLALIPVVVDDVFAGITPLADLGDFKCYEFTPITKGIVIPLLEDQFGPETDVNLIELFKICAFVEKDEGFDFPPSLDLSFIDEPFQHFLVYRIDEPPVGVTVDLTDQFTLTQSQTHMVFEPVELWVPADKEHIECPAGYTFDFLLFECSGPLTPSCPPPDAASFPSGYAQSGGLCVGDPNADFFPKFTEIHYKCYNISPQPFTKTNPVVLHDQFEDHLVNPDNLLDANKLCVPVVKTFFEPFEQSFGTQFADHLKCYPIAETHDIFSELLDVFDQFSDFQLDGNLEEVELCVIADKQVIRGPPPVGGSLIPIDSTSLLLAGAHMTASWLIPIIVAGAGFVLILGSRKSE